MKPMYCLKVGEAENCLAGEVGSLPWNPGICVYCSGALVRNVDKVKGSSAERLPFLPQTGLLKFKTCKGLHINYLGGIK